MDRSLHLTDTLPTDHYDKVAVALHWAIALLLLLQIALGWWMLGIPKSPPGLRAGWFNLHKSIGLTLALLILIRLTWRITHQPPALPMGMAAWQRLAADLTHRALYICMLVMPLSGYLGSAFSKYPVRYFGLPLPKWSGEWPAAKEFMSEVHEFTAWLFVLLLAIHISAAIRHAVRRDGIFLRMWRH